MRMLSTDATAKHRMRVLSAIKLCFPRLPKPVAGATRMAAHTFAIIWLGTAKMAFITQDAGQPSLFVCKTFRHLTVESTLTVDMEAINGPPRLMEFLDTVADWMA